MDDFGTDTFDWSEFDSPDDEEIVRKREEAKFLEALYKGFVAEWKSWTLGNIPDVFDALKAKLEEYELSHGQLELTSYVAMKVLPVVALAVCEELQLKLPASCRLAKEHCDDFIMEFARQMDPHRYAESFVNIVNYVDLLDYAAKPKWSRTLDTNTVNWLKSSAEKEMVRMMQYPPSLDESVPDKEIRAKKWEHLSRIIGERLPSGFNTETEHQWELWNMDFMLDPAGDIREDKLVTRKAYDYVMRAASERLETMNEIMSQDRPHITGTNQPNFELTS